MKKGWVVIAGLALLGGCADRTPLIFVSKTSVGVEVSAPGTGTGEFGASIGVNTLDAAYVPVVEKVDDSKVDVYLGKSGESLAEPDRKDLVNTLSGGITTAAAKLGSLQGIVANTQSTDVQKKAAQAEIETTQAQVQKLSEGLTNVLSRDDALSVFSTFDSNTMLRASSAGQGVGKVFATGLAAQNVSRTFNQQALASAKCKAQVATTVAKLAASTEQADKDLAMKLLEGCK